MKDKRKLFKLGKNWKKRELILYIICPVVYIISVLFKKFFCNLNFSNKSNNLNILKLRLYYCSTYIGYILINGGFLIIKKCKQKKEENKISYSKSNMTYNEIIILFLVILLELLSLYSLLFFSRYKKFEEHKFFFLRIIVLSLISQLLFKIEIHKHHIFSILIIFIGTSIIYILYETLAKPYIVHLSSCIIIHYLSSFSNILGHYILYHKKIKIHFFLFLNGLIVTITVLIIELLNYYNILFKNLNIIEDFKNFIYCDLFLFLILILIKGLDGNLIWLVMKNFRPWFFITSIVIEHISFVFIRNLFDENKLLQFIISIIIMLIELFFCFIFNEQIICYICGFNKNTKEEICKRGMTEINELITNVTFDFDSFIE